MVATKSSMLSDAQRLGSRRVELPNAQCMPCFVVPNVTSRRSLEGILIGLTKRPSILWVLVVGDSIFVEELAGTGVDSPPFSVGDRDPLNNDERVDIPGVVGVAIQIEDLKHLSSRFALKLMKVSVHMLPVRESTLQGKSNRLCGCEARCSVDNDNVKGRFISTVYINLMCSLEITLEASKELEHRNVIVVSIFIGIAWQLPAPRGSGLNGSSSSVASIYASLWYGTSLDQ